MTQPGETSSFSAADHVRALYKHSRAPLFDYVLVNTAPISSAARRRYQKQRAQPVLIDREELEKLGVQVVEGDFVSEQQVGPASARWVRHHSERLAQAVLDIAAKHHYWSSMLKEPRALGPSGPEALAPPSTEKTPGDIPAKQP